MPTQKEIAEHLNISQQAVSESLRGRRGTVKVSEETRRLVLSTAQKLGYVPNQVAHAFRSGRTSMIGVLLPYSNDPYFSALIDALSMEAATRKYSLLFQFHSWSSDLEERALRRLIEARVEGILTHIRVADYRGTSAGRLIETGRMPVVAINSANPENLFFGSLDKDHEKEGFLLASELLRCGHRSIDLLAVSSDHSIQRRRMKGVEFAVRRIAGNARVQHVNLPPEMSALLQPTAPAPSSARQLIIRRLAEYYMSYPDRGSAVIVGNESVAWKLMSVARSRGLKIPEDLSVVCCGVQGHGDTGAIPLTSVEYDPVEIAARSFEVLLDGGGRRVQISPQLASRMSVQELPEQESTSRLEAVSQPIELSYYDQI